MLEKLKKKKKRRTFNTRKMDLVTTVGDLRGQIRDQLSW